MIRTEDGRIFDPARELSSKRLKICTRHLRLVYYDEPRCPACTMLAELRTKRKPVAPKYFTLPKSMRIR
jgi:hypothetical protein